MLKNMTPGQLREALPRPADRPPPTTAPLAAGVYDATEAFRAIRQHACVCDVDTMALVATTGPADDPQSQADADLFAAAPALLARLKVRYERCPCEDFRYECPDCKADKAVIAKAEGR